MTEKQEYAKNMLELMYNRIAFTNQANPRLRRMEAKRLVESLSYEQLRNLNIALGISFSTGIKAVRGFEREMKKRVMKFENGHLKKEAI